MGSSGDSVMKDY